MFVAIFFAREASTFELNAGNLKVSCIPAAAQLREDISSAKHSADVTPFVVRHLTLSNEIECDANVCIVPLKLGGLILEGQHGEARFETIEVKLKRYYFSEEKFSNGTDDLYADKLEDQYRNKLVFLHKKAGGYEISTNICSVSPYHEIFVYILQKCNRDAAWCDGTQFYEAERALGIFVVETEILKLLGTSQ